MKFKIDENLPGEVAAQLRALGHEAGTVIQEDLAGAPDTEIVAAATAEGRILLTLDKGIANLLRHPQAKHHGVVLFRPGSLGRRSVLAFVGDRLTALLDLPWRARSPWSLKAESALDSAPVLPARPHLEANREGRSGFAWLGSNF